MVRQSSPSRATRNVAEAYEFINYLQKPEVAAKNSNFISYANGNLASQKFIDRAILEDKTIYPDEAMTAPLHLSCPRRQDGAVHEPAVDQDQDRK